MKTRALAAAALLLSSTSVYAAGLDRSGQNTSAIFNDHQTLSFTFSHVDPRLSGTDATGANYEAGQSYTQSALSYTHEFNDKFSLTILADQPYGVDTRYTGASPLTSTLGGTGADLDSEALSFIGRYRFNERFSLYGGVKAQRVEATVQLNGSAYRSAIAAAGTARVFNAGLPAGAPQLSSAELGAALAAAQAGNLSGAAAINTRYRNPNAFTGLRNGFAAASNAFIADNGYTYSQDQQTEYGWLIGAAYEIPDIALRLAVTYHAPIEYTANSTETLLGRTIVGETTFETPEAVNIDFQTGIAKDTLLTASYRWADYESVDVIPTGLQRDLVNLDNAERFTLGVGRRFTDNFSGSLTLSYEPEGDDDLVSPLGPTDGLFGISLAGRYTQDNMVISGGINYSWLGDARPEVAGRPVASFTDNSSLAVGFKIDFTF